MRLATIERITEIKDIEGADRIQAARVLGYWTVIKKGEFQVNDLCVWHNPDCVVDLSNPVYAFLKQDARLRVRKFKKQISQGLALPLPVFKFHDATTILSRDMDTVNLVEGDDVTHLVKLIKYEKTLPVTMLGKAKGNFPAFLKKTDEHNLRSCPRVINELIGLYSYITKKVDGCSVTFYVKDGEFGVCSRNWDLKEDEDSIYWKVARQYDIATHLKAEGFNLCLQGEIYGEGIQGNKLQATGLNFAAFNIFDVDAHKYYSYPDLLKFCSNTGIPMVEVIWAGMFNFTLEELIEMANKQEYSPGDPAEGIVIRPCDETESEALHGRLSGKVISEVFALKHGE